MTENIDLILENEMLRKEFIIRNLDVSQILFCQPENPEIENRRLKSMLEWVCKYNELKERKKMEAAGYQFPPIDHCISPEMDWYIFIRWMEGKPLQKKIREQLPEDAIIRHPDSLSDEELEDELDRFLELLSEIRIEEGFNENVPPRLLYTHLFENLEKSMILINEGGWILDGCDGYCPGCFQRPWCDAGIESCWTEDEEQGAICLTDEVMNFVCPSPVSLEILKAKQKIFDAEIAMIRKGEKGETWIEPL